MLLQCSMLSNALQKIRTIVADLFRRRNLEVYEEVHRIAESEIVERKRRTDIIILDRIKSIICIRI